MPIYYQGDCDTYHTYRICPRKHRDTKPGIMWLETSQRTDDLAGKRLCNWCFVRDQEKRYIAEGKKVHA